MIDQHSSSDSVSTALCCLFSFVSEFVVFVVACCQLPGQVDDGCVACCCDLRPACGVRRVYAVFFIARFVRGPGGVHRQIFHVVVQQAVPDPCSAARTNVFSRLRRVVFRVAEVSLLAIHSTSTVCQ